jgi:hypothetical protein
MKTCRHCGKQKSAEEFRPSSHHADGLGSWCASCHADRARRWREENRDKVDARNAARREEYRRRKAGGNLRRLRLDKLSAAGAVSRASFDRGMADA